MDTVLLFGGRRLCVGGGQCIDLFADPVDVGRREMLGSGGRDTHKKNQHKYAAGE